GLVDCAAALLGVEEPADAPEVLVLLAAHGILVTIALDRELGLGLVEAQIEVFGQPLHITLGEGDKRVGAAIPGALLAIEGFSSRHSAGLGCVRGALARIRAAPTGTQRHTPYKT